MKRAPAYGKGTGLPETVDYSNLDTCGTIWKLGRIGKHKVHLHGDIKGYYFGKHFKTQNVFRAPAPPETPTFTIGLRHHGARAE